MNNYTLESAKSFRSLAQFRIEDHYEKLNKTEQAFIATKKAFDLIDSVRNSEESKSLKSAMRSHELLMIQLRQSYIPQTIDAIRELDAEIESFGRPLPQSKTLPPEREPVYV